MELVPTLIVGMVGAVVALAALVAGTGRPRRRAHAAHAPLESRLGETWHALARSDES